MELPTDLPADGWSLFAMSTGQSLDLNDCVLTIQDGDAEHPAIHDQVSMITVQRRSPGETMTMTDSQLAMGQQAKIGLERTIARGEASLVNLTDETPLTIRWNQGLLVTSKHLLETGGSATEPQYYEQIVLDLDNVTACCKQGLYYLRRGPGKAFQFLGQRLRGPVHFCVRPEHGAIRNGRPGDSAQRPKCCNRRARAIAFRRPTCRFFLFAPPRGRAAIVPAGPALVERNALAGRRSLDACSAAGSPASRGDEARFRHRDRHRRWRRGLRSALAARCRRHHATRTAPTCRSRMSTPCAHATCAAPNDRSRFHA